MKIIDAEVITKVADNSIALLVLVEIDKEFFNIFLEVPKFKTKYEESVKDILQIIADRINNGK